MGLDYFDMGLGYFCPAAIITNGHARENVWNEIDRWCVEHTVGRWTWETPNDINSWGYWFESEDDFIMFKLRWL